MDDNQEQMEADMVALKIRLRKCSLKNTGMRLNNVEVAWIEEILNNGWNEGDQ